MAHALTMTTIGKRIAAARRRRGLTQEGLARALDTQSITISRYECDRMAPRRDMLRRIAEALGTSAEALEYGHEREPSPMFPPAELVIGSERCDSEEAAMLRAIPWAQIPRADAALIRDFLLRWRLQQRLVG